MISILCVAAVHVFCVLDRREMTAAIKRGMAVLWCFSNWFVSITVTVLIQDPAINFMIDVLLMLEVFFVEASTIWKWAKMSYLCCPPVKMNLINYFVW